VRWATIAASACRLKTGEGYAFLVVGGEVLDNRFDDV
jgi:hypothetical protein